MIFGWDLPPNSTTLVVGLVPVLALLIKNNVDTARTRRETKSSNGTTMAQQVERLSHEVEQLNRRFNTFVITSNARHKQNVDWIARIEDDVINQNRQHK